MKSKPKTKDKNQMLKISARGGLMQQMPFKAKPSSRPKKITKNPIIDRTFA